MAIKHTKNNNIADWTEGELQHQISNGNFPQGTTLDDIVLPSDWNDDHEITSDIDLGGFSISGNDANFNTFSAKTSYTITGSETTGQTFWDSTNQTLATKLNDNVTLQHGQETHIYIKNQTGATLSDGKAIMFAGAVGASGRLKGQYAIADGSLPASYTMGVATESIADGGDGFVTSFGKVNKIDTTGTPYGETWVEGDLLYISPTTAGALTKIEPQAPNLAILVAAVVNVHAINGTIFVRPTLPHKLVDLADVNGTPLTTSGQIPVWNNTAGYFDFDFNINDYLKTTYETVSKNLKQYDYNIAYNGSDNIDYITYDLGGGLSIVKTFNYTGTDLTSIVLSGNTPSGIDLTKTLSYTSGNLTGVAYS